MPAPDSITPDKLAKLLGTPRCPTILDNRRDGLRNDDPLLLPGARAIAEADLVPERLEPLIASLSGPVVVACAEGHGRSQGLAALLRSRGIAAEYLEGGYAAWRAAGLPLIDPAKMNCAQAVKRFQEFLLDYDGRLPYPWKLNQNYGADLMNLRFGKVDDGVLAFAGAEQSALQAAE